VVQYVVVDDRTDEPDPRRGVPRAPGAELEHALYPYGEMSLQYGARRAMRFERRLHALTALTGVSSHEWIARGVMTADQAELMLRQLMAGGLPPVMGQGTNVPDALVDEIEPSPWRRRALLATASAGSRATIPHTGP